MNLNRFVFIYIIPILVIIHIATSNFRILGGNRVKIEDYPYVVSLQIFTGGRFQHVCGGTLITPNLILSAAHCFRSGILYAIRAGSENLRSREGCMVRISSVIYHPKYRPLSQDYDIAIAVLVKPVKLSAKIQPAKLPESSKKVPLETGTVLGWGGTRSSESNTNFLNAVSIPIIEDEECVRSYPKGLVTERMFCAVDETGGKDSCQGDSGGPLMINGTIYGIVSWGFDCGKPESPGVYTKVPYFVDFINMSIAQMTSISRWFHG